MQILSMYFDKKKNKNEKFVCKNCNLNLNPSSWWLFQTTNHKGQEKAGTECSKTISEFRYKNKEIATASKRKIPRTKFEPQNVLYGKNSQKFFQIKIEQTNKII